VRHGVLFVDDATIVYTTGSNIVFFDTENRSQKFFSPLTHPQSYITAIACHGDKKLLLVAEKTPSRLPTLTLYELDGLNKKKSFSIPVDSKEEKTVFHQVINELGNYVIDFFKGGTSFLVPNEQSHIYAVLIFL
jgi:hypothetical protein